MAVLAYFSYGISVFSLKNCGITIFEIWRYTVFAILDSKTAVIDKICLRYYGTGYPPMPPSLYLKQHPTVLEQLELSSAEYAKCLVQIVIAFDAQDFAGKIIWLRHFPILTFLQRELLTYGVANLTWQCRVYTRQ
jgi:hypothetical protein